MESHNRLIKDDHTPRERMDLGKFRSALFSMVEIWAIKYTSGIKSMNFDAPLLTLDLWTKGYHFAKSNVKFTSQRRGNSIIFRSAMSDQVNDVNE